MSGTRSTINVEVGFAIAFVVIMVIGGGLAIAAQPGEDAPEHATFDPPVPAVEGFSAPTDPGVALVDGERFESIQMAVDAAEPGETIHVAGRFDERVIIDTPDITLRSETGVDDAMIAGGGEGTVLTIRADNVTVDSIWIHGSGIDRSAEDAGILVDGAEATITNARITDSSFGIWVDGVPNATIEGTTIVGLESLPIDERGNGIHLWEADGALVRENAITRVRDGIYYSYSSNVVAESNTMWNLRYGVHYMFSNDNRLVDNVAFDNDVGFALMVSSNLTIEDNVAVNNVGRSSHGILVKDIDRSVIRGNHLVANGNGIFSYNAQDNRIEGNLLLGNERGLVATAGTRGEVVVGNSFVENGQAAFVDRRSHVAWNESDRGNFWSDANAVDLTGDGTSEIRHQPTGAIERVLQDRPQARIFASSPAFEAVRLAENSFPVIESPGAVDHHPLTESPHDWSEYHER